MTITQEINGESVEIKLTDSELVNASNEYDLDCYADDVLSKLQEMAERGDIPLTVEQLDAILKKRLRAFAEMAADHVDHDLGKNDPYFEAFWFTVENVLTNRINWDEELPKLLAA